MRKGVGEGGGKQRRRRKILACLRICFSFSSWTDITYFVSCYYICTVLQMGCAKHHKGRDGDQRLRHKE